MCAAVPSRGRTRPARSQTSVLRHDRQPPRRPQVDLQAARGMTPGLGVRALSRSLAGTPRHVSTRNTLDAVILPHHDSGQAATVVHGSRMSSANAKDKPFNPLRHQAPQTLAQRDLTRAGLRPSLRRPARAAPRFAWFVAG
jgi:hypothetical protein